MKEQSAKSHARSLASNGKFNEALESFRSLRKQLIDKYGLAHRSTELNQIQVEIAEVLNLKGEYDEAFTLYMQTLEEMEKNPEEYVDEIFEAKCHVAALYSRKMKKNMAGKIYDELREHIQNFKVDWPKMIDYKTKLANSLRQSGELQSALDIFTEIYQIRSKGVDYRVVEDELGVEDREKARITAEYSHVDVGVVLLEQGKFREALTVLEEVHSTFKTDNYEEIPFLRLKRYLADAHMYIGLVEIAEDLYKNLMKAVGDKIPFHPEVLGTMHNWGRSLDRMNQPSEAICVLTEVYSKRCKQSPKHLDTARIALDIATIHLNQKEYSGAIIAFLNVPAQISNVIKWNPDLLLHSVSCIASILNNMKDGGLKEQVLETYQHVYQKQSAMRGSSIVHKDYLETATLVGEFLISLNKPNDALEVLKDVLEKRTRRLKNDYMDCVNVLKNIARAYYGLNQRVEAFEYYSEVHEIQKLITGDNSVEVVLWEKEFLNIAPAEQKTILIDAVVSNYKTSLKGNADSENNVSMEENFPLHVAAETGRIAMVKFLLFKGAIYNEKNSEGKMPADIACSNSVKNLLNLIDKLFLAVKKMDHESIDKVLDIMNDTSLREDDNRGFPMLLTGSDQIRDIIDKTILNGKEETGSTLLHLACSNGDVKAVKRLLDLDVDRTLTDKRNLSPRDVAEDNSLAEVLQLLDSYKIKKKEDLEDSAISQKNPEMPEDVMDA